VTNLAAIALALPGVEQGIACAGTALESRTFRVNEKAFLFVSREHARLKLDRSLADARKRGADVGAGGWTKLNLDALPPTSILRRWIAESHELLSSKPAAKKDGAQSKPAQRKRKKTV